MLEQLMLDKETELMNSPAWVRSSRNPAARGVTALAFRTKEVKTLREQSRSTFDGAPDVLPAPAVSGVAAETSMDEKLAEEGLTVLALRNDTIDTDQDGDIDAIRVVIVLNSTASSNELIVQLRGLHKGREVLETQKVRSRSNQHYAGVRCLVERRAQPQAGFL